MPWYYSGPEAKPLGPVSAEQLQALHASGTISSETFVIEHTGTAGATLAWKRYREIFPTAAALPPIPHPAQPASHPGFTAPPAPQAPAPGLVPPPNPSSPAPVAHHPLFPSAAGHAPVYAVPGHHPASGHHPYAPIRPTNSWCAWGFALSLLGLCFAFACGIGIFPAIIAVVLCIIGLVQVSRNHSEGGQGLAITGLIFSGVALLLAILIIAWFSPYVLKAHGLTVTEQTSNDSE